MNKIQRNSYRHWANFAGYFFRCLHRLQWLVGGRWRCLLGWQRQGTTSFSPFRGFFLVKMTSMPSLLYDAGSWHSKARQRQVFCHDQNSYISRDSNAKPSISGQDATPLRYHRWVIPRIILNILIAWPISVHPWQGGRRLLMSNRIRSAELLTT